MEAVKASQYYQGDPSEQDLLESISRGLAISTEPQMLNWLCCRFCMCKGKSVTFPTESQNQHDTGSGSQDHTRPPSCSHTAPSSHSSQHFSCHCDPSPQTDRRRFQPSASWTPSLHCFPHFQHGLFEIPDWRCGANPSHPPPGSGSGSANTSHPLPKAAKAAKGPKSQGPRSVSTRSRITRSPASVVTQGLKASRLKRVGGYVPKTWNVTCPRS